jgi:hypothetical protein
MISSEPGKYVPSIHAIHLFSKAFRWHNTTHIVFAASVLLLHIMRFKEVTPCEWWEANVKVVEMAVELLEAMDECEVAKKAAGVIKRCLNVAKSLATAATALESSTDFDKNSLFDSFPTQYLEQTMELTDTVCSNLFSPLYETNYASVSCARARLS